MTFSFLSPKIQASTVAGRRLSTLRVDLNAHFLPGLDDGSIQLEESIRMARFFVQAGIEKVIATPYIMDGFYQNTPEQIRSSGARLTAELRDRRIPLKVDAAAEYYVCKDFLRQLRENPPLMTFGKSHQSYILLETGLISEPSELQEVIKILAERGIKPILAHPERCYYLQSNFERSIELFRMGLLYQIDWRSFSSRQDVRVRKLAQQLVDYRMVSFAGSNLHREDEIPYLSEASKDSYFQLMTEVGLVNNELS
jgi:protein-tyrosine phosphatase